MDVRIDTLAALPRSQESKDEGPPSGVDSNLKLPAASSCPGTEASESRTELDCTKRLPASSCAGPEFCRGHTFEPSGPEPAPSCPEAKLPEYIREPPEYIKEPPDPCSDPGQSTLWAEANGEIPLVTAMAQCCYGSPPASSDQQAVTAMVRTQW